MAQVKILYVEDEPFLAKIVRETLEAKNYVVEHVDRGDEALRSFRSFDPDICILDVMLPGKTGFEIGADIRSLDRNIPIIFLTAKDQTQDLVKGFASGGNDYIKKPFSMEELMVRVDNLLALTTTNVGTDIPDVMNLGQLSFDTNKMVLRSADKVVQLSHRENEILKMICGSLHGQVARKEILMKIWGDDSFFNSRNLDVYIRKIRKYLAADPSIELITLKGIGYRLVID